MIAWERPSKRSTANFSSFWPTRRSRPSVNSIGDPQTQRRTATAEGASLADIRQEGQIAGAFDGGADRALEGGAIAAPLPREHLALRRTHFLEQPDILVIDVGRGGQPSGVQKRQRFLRLRPKRLRGIYLNPMTPDVLAWKTSRRIVFDSARSSQDTRLPRDCQRRERPIFDGL